jgi:hypothetical protein
MMQKRKKKKPLKGNEILGYGLFRLPERRRQKENAYAAFG